MLSAGAFLPVGGQVLADRIRDQQWHLSFFDVAGAHRLSQGEGTTVGSSTPAFPRNIPTSPVTSCRSRRRPGRRRQSLGDIDRHGTGMCGLIAPHGHGSANGDGALGLAPKAKILPVRLATTDPGSGDSIAMADAVDAAVQRGAKVISIAERTSARRRTERCSGPSRPTPPGGDRGGARRRQAARGDHRRPGPVAECRRGGCGRQGRQASQTSSCVARRSSAPRRELISPAPARAPGTASAPVPAIRPRSFPERRRWSGPGSHPDKQAGDRPHDRHRDRQGAAGRVVEYGFGVVNPVKALSTTPAAPSATPTLEPTRVIRGPARRRTRQGRAGGRLGRSSPSPAASSCSRPSWSSVVLLRRRRS